MNSIWGISSLVAAMGAILLVMLVIAAKAAFVITDQYNLKIVKRWGQFVRVLKPGPSWIIPFIETTTPPISTKVNVANIVMDGIKTRDGAFPKIVIKIHYSIVEPILAYRLAQLEQQLDTLVKNYARPEIASQDLAAVYTEPQIMAKMADAFSKGLKEKMDSYGLIIADVLIETPDISDALRDALQSVIISLNKLAAARNTAEATQITITAQARGEALGKIELGKGIRQQQEDITEGFKNAIENLIEAKLGPTDALDFLKVINSLQISERIAQIQSGMPNALLIGYTPSPAHPSFGSFGNGSGDDISKIVPIIAAMLRIVQQQDTTGVAGSSDRLTQTSILSSPTPP